MLIDRKWNKGVATSLVELALELDPVEPERVQEALHDIHAHHHTHGDGGKNHEAHKEHDDLCSHVCTNRQV